MIAGLESKNSTLIEKEKKIVSYHEAGHALVSNLVGICPIQKISIVPRGQALGYVLQFLMKIDISILRMSFRKNENITCRKSF